MENCDLHPDTHLDVPLQAGVGDGGKVQKC